MTLGAEPGASGAGEAGFEDKVNNHYARIFGSAILMSLIGGGMTYAMDTGNASGSESGSESESMRDALVSSLASQLGQTSLALLEQNSAISPTLEVRPGYLFRVVLTRDIAFRAPYARVVGR